VTFSLKPSGGIFFAKAGGFFLLLLLGMGPLAPQSSLPWWERKIRASGNDNSSDASTEEGLEE
jgi:hypothetical protein